MSFLKHVHLNCHSVVFVPGKNTFLSLVLHTYPEAVLIGNVLLYIIAI